MFNLTNDMKTRKALFFILFILGVILMVFNITGLFKSLRNEELYSEITPYKDDITIRFENAKKQWVQGIKKYNMRVPLWENYILRIKQWVTGRKKYEFRNYKKVIERGVGICSQPCIGLKYLLNANGIEADLWDLQQHIVVGVTFYDETEYTLDPDYGYVIPVAMSGLQKNPNLVRTAYKNHDDVYAPHLTEHKHTEDLVKMYTQEGNHIYYMKKSFEDFSYIAKWVLPFLLILPYVVSLILKK